MSQQAGTVNFAVTELHQMLSQAVDDAVTGTENVPRGVTPVTGDVTA